MGAGRPSASARTICQYWDEASYFRMRTSDVRLWTYRHPDHAAAGGGEHPGVHIIVDGTPEKQP